MGVTVVVVTVEVGVVIAAAAVGALVNLGWVRTTPCGVKLAPFLFFDGSRLDVVCTHTTSRP